MLYNSWDQIFLTFGKGWFKALYLYFDNVKQDYLKSILHYSPETGVFRHLTQKNGRVKAGQRAGSNNSDGYCQIKIDGKNYKAHKLAVLYMTGHYPEYPREEVDHLDTVKDNNRWSNLQVGTKSDNKQNPISKAKMIQSVTIAMNRLEVKKKLQGNQNAKRKLR